MTRILSVNTGGKGDLHELRARQLASYLHADVTYFNINKSISRRAASKELWQVLSSTRWDLVYQESTGIAGGLNLIRAAITRKQPFIVSSGDPISGFFHVTKGPLVSFPFSIYEKWLYRTCAGFVGWTPYLTGRALHLGASRGVTVEGSVDLNIFQPYTNAGRSAARQQYGLPDNHLICGGVGSLHWNPRQSYCYGLDMIETLKHMQRQDVSLLIVGDGNGRKILEAAIPAGLRARVVFTGKIAPLEVVNAMNAMDIGFITQTLDGLGNYRLTTKLPEYLACGLPVAMSPVPGYFDYVGSAGWALPAFHPASAEFHLKCAKWLDALSREEVYSKSCLARLCAERHFDYQITGARFRAFVDDLI